MLLQICIQIQLKRVKEFSEQRQLWETKIKLKC